MAEGSKQAGAETIFQPGIVRVVLIEAPLDAGLTLAEAADDLSGYCGPGGSGGLWAGLFNGDGDLVLELDPVAEAVVDVKVGHLIGTRGGVTRAYPAEVDLPLLVARCLGVVGAKGRATLRIRRNREGGWKDDERQSRPAKPLKALSLPSKTLLLRKG